MSEAVRAADDLPSIAQRPTFLVHQLNAELGRICNPLFRRLGVDLITSRILVILLETKRAYIGDVVNMMALPQSTVSHQIKRLEQAGFVQRRMDEADNRAYVAVLTDTGRRVARQCNEISASIYAELFRDIDPQSMTALVGQLQQMSARLKAISATTLAPQR